MRRSIPPLNALRAFEAFARHGRMTLAADELCVTHGAVSRHIKRLEESLGLALTSGPRNNLKLTNDGERLADELTAVFDRLQAALPTAPAGKRILNVACVNTIATTWLIPRLASFLAANPGVGVHLVDSNGPTRDANVAIQLGHDAPAEAAEVHPFLERYHGPVAAPQQLPEGPGREAALLTLPRLVSRTYPQVWEHWATASGVDLLPGAPVRRFARYLHTIDAARAGLGATVGAWDAVKDHVVNGILVAPMGFVRALTPSVVVRAQARQDPLELAFCDWLVEEGRKSAPPEC